MVFSPAQLISPEIAKTIEMINQKEAEDKQKAAERSRRNTSHSRFSGVSVDSGAMKKLTDRAAMQKIFISDKFNKPTVRNSSSKNF